MRPFCFITVPGGSEIYYENKKLALVPDPDHARTLVEILNFVEDAKPDFERIRKAGDRLADDYATLVAITARTPVDIEKLPAVKEWRNAR